MTHSCTLSLHVKPTLRNSFAMRMRCPECGEWLRIRPDVQRGINVLAVLVFWIPLLTRSSMTLSGVFWLVLAMLAVALGAGWIAVRCLPMTHVSGLDKAVDGYRHFLQVVLAIALASRLPDMDHRASLALKSRRMPSRASRASSLPVRP